LGEKLITADVIIPSSDFDMRLFCDLHFKRDPSEEEEEFCRSFHWKINSDGSRTLCFKNCNHIVATQVRSKTTEIFMFEHNNEQIKVRMEQVKVYEKDYDKQFPLEGDHEAKMTDEKNEIVVMCPRLKQIDVSTLQSHQIDEILKIPRLLWNFVGSLLTAIDNY